jgi:hypothetical protein
MSGAGAEPSKSTAGKIIHHFKQKAKLMIDDVDRMQS